MHKSRFDSSTQVVGTRHVTDGDVNKNPIELALKPDTSHVALDVFAFRIQSSADLEHPRGSIDQSHLEPALQVGSVVPATTTELNHRTSRLSSRGAKIL